MKIFIGIPCDKGWMRSETALSYAANLLFLRDKGYEVNGTVVGLESAFNARAIIVEEATKWNADFIGMMDDDMVVNPDIFYRLIQRDVDAIIPLTTSRKKPYDPVIYKLVKPKPEFKDIHRNRYVPKFDLRKGLNECEGFGTGVVLFKSSIFKKIMRPWFWAIPPTQLEDGRITQATGEDLFFCSRAREFGIKLHYDGDIEVGHIGESIIATPALSKLLNTITISEE